MDNVETSEGKRLIEVQGLSHRYGGRQVLRDVSFELARGEVLTLIGPNGSGKTTLLKMLSGLIELKGAATSGKILFKGQDLAEFEVRRFARSVVYVAPDLRVGFPLSVREFVLMSRLSHDDSDWNQVEAALGLCGITAFGDRDISTLSGGELQLVGLARALAQQSPVVLLDEALSRMDLHHQAATGALMRKLAAEKGLSFVLVSHDLNVASEWADRALLLQAGRVFAAGVIGDVLCEKYLQVLYPNAPLRVAPSPISGKPKVFFK